MSIYKPGYKKSNKRVGHPGNILLYNQISDKILITTEIWDESRQQPWTLDKNNQPNNKFKLIMKWEIGKTYAITKIVNEKDDLVYYFCDICSPIKKENNIFVFQDWYLDVIKKPNQKPVLEDINEFNEAIECKYFTNEEIKIAKKTASFVLKLMDTENFTY